MPERPSRIDVPYRRHIGAERAKPADAGDDDALARHVSLFWRSGTRTASTMSPTVGELAPGFGGVHLDLDPVGFLEVENDLGEFERMDAELAQFGVGVISPISGSACGLILAMMSCAS